MKTKQLGCVLPNFSNSQMLNVLDQGSKKLSQLLQLRSLIRLVHLIAFLWGLSLEKAEEVCKFEVLVHIMSTDVGDS